MTRDVLTVAAILEALGLLGVSGTVLGNNVSALYDPRDAEIFRQCIYNRTDPDIRFTFEVDSFNPAAPASNASSLGGRRSLARSSGEDGGMSGGSSSRTGGGASLKTSEDYTDWSWMQWNGYVLPTFQEGFNIDLIKKGILPLRKRYLGTGINNIMLGGMLLHQTRRARSTEGYYASSSFEPCTSDFDELDISCSAGEARFVSSAAAC